MKFTDLFSLNTQMKTFSTNLLTIFFVRLTNPLNCITCNLLLKLYIHPFYHFTHYTQRLVRDSLFATGGERWDCKKLKCSKKINRKMWKHLDFYQRVKEKMLHLCMLKMFYLLSKLRTKTDCGSVISDTHF